MRLLLLLAAEAWHLGQAATVTLTLPLLPWTVAHSGDIGVGARLPVREGGNSMRTDNVHDALLQLIGLAGALSSLLRCCSWLLLPLSGPLLLLPLPLPCPLAGLRSSAG